MKKSLLYILLFCSVQALSQQDTVLLQKLSSPDYRKRQWLIGGATVAGYGGSYIFLSQAWYKGYPHSSFHTFNDVGEWLQMDKIGHAWSAYHTSRFTTAMWRWAGVSPNKALLLGTGSSLLYMLSIEYLDGHSAEWGWSWGDAGADAFGAATYALQELGWKQQKIQIKFSAHYKNYSEPDLKKRADEIFGNTFQGRILKDYNAQSYWLSFNLKSFLPRSNLPDWLNVSLGYGAEGMFGGYDNYATDKTGSVTFDRRDIKRYRQWYLAPDIDLSKIKTKSQFLNTALSMLNALKFPLPTLEFSNGSFKMKAFVY